MKEEISIVVPEAVGYLLGSKILKKFAGIDIILEDYYKETQKAKLRKKIKDKYFRTLS